jgi:hypothetical protein
MVVGVSVAPGHSDHEQCQRTRRCVVMDLVILSGGLGPVIALEAACRLPGDGHLTRRFRRKVGESANGEIEVVVVYFLAVGIAATRAKIDDLDNGPALYAAEDEIGALGVLLGDRDIGTDEAFFVVFDGGNLHVVADMGGLVGEACGVLEIVSRVPGANMVVVHPRPFLLLRFVLFNEVSAEGGTSVGILARGHGLPEFGVEILVRGRGGDEGRGGKDANYGKKEFELHCWRREESVVGGVFSSLLSEERKVRLACVLAQTTWSVAVNQQQRWRRYGRRN